MTHKKLLSHRLEDPFSFLAKDRGENLGFRYTRRKELRSLVEVAFLSMAVKSMGVQVVLISMIMNHLSLHGLKKN